MSEPMSSRDFPDNFMCSKEILQRFEPTIRPSDVFITTPPKTGQTWLTCMLYHLKTKGQCPDMCGKGMHKAIPWLESPKDFFTKDGNVFDPEERIKELSAVEDPRIFKLHLDREFVPRPEGHGSKMIIITRDPRDVPYSFYEHLRALQDADELHFFLPKGRDTTFEEFFDLYVTKSFHYVSFLKSFWPHRNDPNLLWLRYEDMKKNTRECADKIVSFLQWDVSDEEIDRAIQLSEFEHMQKVEKKVLYPGDKSQFRRDSSFIREGSVGKNRKKLTKDMEKTLMALFENEFPPEVLEFIMPKQDGIVEEDSPKN